MKSLAVTQVFVIVLFFLAGIFLGGMVQFRGRAEHWDLKRQFARAVHWGDADDHPLDATHDDEHISRPPLKTAAKSPARRNDDNDKDEEDDREAATVAPAVTAPPIDASDDFRGIRCPPFDAGIEKLQIPLEHLPRKRPTSVAQKYDRRANNCAGNGIWNRVRKEDHHKILHHIQALGQFKQGDLVLDWGSGCGHSMQYLFEEYKVRSIGIDVSNKTTEWARASLTNKNMYCVADGTRLGFLPTSSLDGAFSFGSIYHVYNRTLFCHVLRNLVRVVKVGGVVYNGWTENSEYHRKHVEVCLGDLPVKAKILEEKVEFKDVEIFPLKARQRIPNTYSLVITKLKAVPPEDEDKAFSLDTIPVKCDKHKCQKKAPAANDE